MESVSSPWTWTDQESFEERMLSEFQDWATTGYKEPSSNSFPQPHPSSLGLPVCPSLDTCSWNTAARLWEKPREHKWVSQPTAPAAVPAHSQPQSQTSRSTFNMTLAQPRQQPPASKPPRGAQPAPRTMTNDSDEWSAVVLGFWDQSHAAMENSNKAWF